MSDNGSTINSNGLLARLQPQDRERLGEAMRRLMAHGSILGLEPSQTDLYHWCYLRAYRRYSSRKPEPSLGLVPIDEAFSKLSGERIKDCITALKAFDLQGVFSMSTGNIPYAFEHCDWLVVVSKDERRLGKRTEIRNIPVSLARDSDDARRLMAK